MSPTLTFERLKLLEQSLPTLTEALRKDQLPHVKAFAENKKITLAELTQGLEAITRTIQSSPIHIGFICEASFFSDSGAFWPQGKYLNRALWARLNNYRPSAPLPLESKKCTPALRPIYGAVNISMLGHTGWGGSCFILKPHIMVQCELRSRDSGDPNGVGQFAQQGSINKMALIIDDWARTGLLDKVWQAMTTKQRSSFKPSHQLPLEAAIYTQKGFLSHKDIGLIFIKISELEYPDKQIKAIQNRCKQLDIPVIFHQQEEEGDVAFHDYSAYQKLIKEYGDYHATNTRNFKTQDHGYIAPKSAIRL